MLFLVLLSLCCSLLDAQFVSRVNSKLYLNGKEFRFGGANIYWIGLDENVGGVAYPTTFRVDDVLHTAKEMGHAALRTHTLGVSTGNKAGNNLTYHPYPNVWNDKALFHMDYAVYKAGQLGLKLVIPLTDNYHYYHGGKHDFTDWRGVSEDQFYYNTQVISDFKQYIYNLLSHKNMYSNVVLKDDPTVMAWETGNEIHPPTAWTKEISEYIKSLAPRHLVLDGTYGVNSASLGLSSVDLYSDHFYPLDDSRLKSDAIQVANANKVFMVGEYGWNQGDLSQWISTLQSLPLAGDCYWDLFPHADDYGFEKHNDDFTVHYPGDNPSMTASVQMLRTHAFYMDGQSPPPANLIPLTPEITLVSQGKIAWRGAAAAGTYSVEKSTSGSNGPWTVICDRCANDNQTPWQSSSIINAWYRVRGFNLNGQPGPYSVVSQ